jgi:hypothetical protein
LIRSTTRPLSIHGPTIPERKWIRLLREWQRSGLQGSEWCRHRGLKESAFRFWKKEIPDRARRRQKKGRTGKPPNGRLLRARVVENQNPSAFAPLDVLLGPAREVRITGDFDPALLRKVVQVLEVSR